MKLAFKDSGDGYYEYDSPDGSIPEWAIKLTPCSVQTPSIQSVPLSQQAKNALDKSDVTMLRCVEAGVAVPAEWNTYRKSLRAISNGSDTASTTLPTQPAYPAGT